jgi:hypothetical protein
MKRIHRVLSYVSASFGAILLMYSIIMNFTQTVALLQYPVFPRSEWPDWATPFPRLDPPYFFTEWHDYIRFAFMGALLILIGVFSVNHRYFWIPLFIIGLTSVLSYSGQYLDMRKYWDINNYVFLGSQGDFRNYLMDYIAHMLPGIACVTGSILLKRRNRGSVPYNNESPVKN